MTAVATKSSVAEPADAAERVVPLVNEKCVVRNRAGTVWGEWHVRFPEGGILDDLKLPHIWKRCQQHAGTAFKRFDELRIIAFDGTWIARCTVAHASQTEVILSEPRVETMPDSRENLFQDATYYVKFVGNGYAVFRKVDDQQMVPAVHSADAAQTVLLNLYPKQVG